MQTKITLIYDNPVDAVAFEEAFPEQLALARTVPGVRIVEASQVWRKEDGSPTPAHRLLDLYFDDYDAASAAAAAGEAPHLFESVFTAATGGVRIVFAAVEERCALPDAAAREAA